MSKFRGQRAAFGPPGIQPRWARGNKEGVGTAYSTSSKVWFTLRNGIITEVYYPTVDRPHVRDLQYLVTDGETFFHEEKRDLRSHVERLSYHVLGYRIANTEPQGRYTVHKEVITDPHLPCVLQHTWLSGEEELLAKLRLYVLCAPHVAGGGWGNNARIVEVAGREVLTAERNGTWLSIMATSLFRRLSCGYVGTSDGWSDLVDNFQMDWDFDQALNGNVALTAEVDLRREREFTLGVALGDSLHSSVTTLFQSLGFPFRAHRRRYSEQWNRACRKILPLEQVSDDQGDLYHSSYSLLMAHEDKTYPGAMIASLSIPWGEAKSDDDKGGYHLVWTRDMVNSAMGLLAAGNTETPMRALIYLAATQQEDGGFPQNFWIDGSPYWSGVQLDEVALPVLLAWRLWKAGLGQEFDSYPMVMRAARYLIHNGPVTQQERWEEASGYSPSTLASNIAALCCAAAFARERGDLASATYLEEYADFLECHIESWTVTTEGSLVPSVGQHYIRVHPVNIDDPRPDEDPNHGILTISNAPPGSPREYPAKNVVDAGFLELVRYGIRRPGDPLIEASLEVVDATLRVETPSGACWRRYSHDGYGQREDGGSFEGWGKGRAWPLLTGERGHYELAAGRYVRPFIQAMERFASDNGLLPEQVWDKEDRPELYLHLGKSTGSAMPLMWAHAEYIRLLRSAFDGQVFDLIPEVAERYLAEERACKPLEVWKPNRQPKTVARETRLRVQVPASFRLRWTRDEWQTTEDTPSSPTTLGVEFVDIPIPPDQQDPIRFTFFWPATDGWEGRDYEVQVK